MSAIIKPRIPQIDWRNPITQELVLDMPFFEGGGSAPFNIVNHLPGTLTGALWKNDIFGKMLSFAGGAATDNVRSGNFSVPNAQISVETYFYLNAIDTTARRMHDPSVGNPGGLVLISSTQNLDFQQNFSTTNGEWNVPQPSTAKWHHLLISFDGSNVANKPNFYLDGIPQTVTTVTAPVGSMVTGTVNLYIGNRSDLLRAFNGYLLYYRIFNRIVSQIEAIKLYENPFRIYKQSKSGLFLPR